MVPTGYMQDQSGFSFFIPSSKQLCLFMVVLFIILFPSICRAEAIVKIGLNYPKSGPYSVEGLDQLRTAHMAVYEINRQGGILGHKIELVIRDSASDVRKTKDNVRELIEQQGVKMVFGGSSSAVAIAASAICQQFLVPFFGTLTYSTATTGEEGHRVCFRECYNSWMAAKVMAEYLRTHFSDKRYYYITADYTWGWTTEESVRNFTETMDKTFNPGVLTRLGTKNFINELKTVKAEKPDVLVLVLFGKDMVNCLRQATVMGIKDISQIVVPNVTLGMAKGAGPKAMEGVIGALPWTWRVPEKYGYDKGKEFVDAFIERYNSYPSTSGASAYAILWEYKRAVERAQSFETEEVVKALEGHSYTLLKNRQTWREFDHQSIQTVYMVKCKPAAQVLQDRFQLDYFEIIHSMNGELAARTHEEWKEVRRKATKPVILERFPGETN